MKALQRAGDKDNLPLFARVHMPATEPDAHLPSMLPGEQVIEDYHAIGICRCSAHPVSLLAHADCDAARRSRPARAAAPQSFQGQASVTMVAGIVLVRQRPGTGQRRHLHDARGRRPGIANTVIWPRKFEQYRPIVMGARLISVTGVLQNEKGVIHIVAGRFEDLTPLLGRLSEHGHRIDTIMPPDAIKRPVYSRQRHPRAGDALVTMLKVDGPDIEKLARAQNTSQVMPKGRNFH